MRTPNLFVVGFPKCGTTSLAAWASRHAQIYVPKVKEPGYFGSELPSVDRRGKVYNEEEYLSLYMGARAERWRCDASTSYIASADAVSQIESRVQAEARYVVLLRPPEDMVASLHREEIYAGNETELDLERAWRAMEEREAAFLDADEPGKWKLYKTLYRHHASIGKHLERLYSQVPRARIHVLLLRDLTEAPDSAIQELCNFLEIRYDRSATFPHSNAAKAHALPWLTRLLWAEEGVTGTILNRAKIFAHSKGIVGVRSRIIAALTISAKKGADSASALNVIREQLADERSVAEELIGRSLL